MTGATVDPGGGFEALVLNGANVRVTAVTQPNDGETHAALAWNGGQAGDQPSRREVSRDNPGEVNVTAQLDGGTPVTVRVTIRDITALVSETGAVHAPNTWKIYAAVGGQASVRATTAPLCYNRVRWSPNCGASLLGAQFRVVDVSRPGDIVATATLLTKTLSITLHVCQWPDLVVRKVVFSGGHTVNKDTIADFDNEWQEGRTQPDQSPICFVRDTPITVAAVLRVTTHPTDPETVSVRGKAVVGARTLTWTAAGINVGTAANTVNFPATASDLNIPDVVECYDLMTIKWEMTISNGAWKPIGETKHVLYSILGAPNGVLPYWTLLDNSCRAARGLSAEDPVAAAVFQPFHARRVVRKRDAKPLTYWSPEANSTKGTAELLAAPAGNGQCGAWAELLIDMYRVHGITTGEKVWVGTKSYHSNKCLTAFGVPSVGRAVTASQTVITPAVGVAALAAGRNALAAFSAATAPLALTAATDARLDAITARMALPAQPTGTLAPHFLNLRTQVVDAKTQADGVAALGTAALKATAANTAIEAARLADVYRSRCDADPGADNDTKAVSAAMAAAAWAFAAATVKDAFAQTYGFLVKGWTFEHPPASNAGALTHELAPSNAVLGFFSRALNGYCRCTNPIPGQQNASPPPKFVNHFIVRYTPTLEFYDPSYGVGPYPNGGAWEHAAVDGLWNDDQAGFDASLRPNPPDLVSFYSTALLPL